jgi:hypothetical protein
MTNSAEWLADLGDAVTDQSIDGLVAVAGYDRAGLSPEEVAVIEKASAFGAHAVFFEASRNNRAPVAQAFVFVSNGPADDPAFGEIHRRLWSWGGVPLLYRKTPGLIQLFRCAHKPDFISARGETICKPFKILNVAAAISSDPWWDASRLRNGTLWDDPEVCKAIFSATKCPSSDNLRLIRRLQKEGSLAHQG